MNKFLAAAAIVASLGVALPAAAQTYGGYDRGYNTGFNGGGLRSDRGIEARIERGLRDGSLTQSEARNLSRQLDEIHRLEWQFSRNGVSPSEARTLAQRYASLENRLRAERRDRDTRWGDRGYGQGYGRGGYGYR